jgi:hypothetical protein
MNQLYITTLLDIAYDFIHVLALTALIISLLIGLLLITKPALVIRWNNHFQKSYSMRQKTRALEQPHNLDRFFYRYHRSVGAVVSVISAYIFYYFSMVFEINMLAIIFSGYSSSLLALLADWLRILMLFVSALTLIIGLTILLRPSGLKSFEAWANRWISTRQATRSLSSSYQNLDQLLLSHPRLFGLIVVVLCVYSIISLILIYN